MSYGQNQPQGLQALKYLNNAPWNNQTNTYLIASGYANNIFRGDLVYINNAGYVKSLYDCGVGSLKTPTLGVFAGCSYVSPTSVNPIDPASPGKPYWPSGTNTVGGLPATAFIIDDPNVVYDIQSNFTGGGGVVQANIGMYAPFNFPNNGAGQVTGNTNQGTSMGSMGTPVTGSAQTNTGYLNNLFIRALSANPNNREGVQYNNAEVIIANHYYRQLPLIPSLA